MPGRAPAQGGQPRQPFGPQLKAALVQAAPLFSAMAAGYSSGRGPYAYLDQGIAGMQAMQKQKRDEEAAAAAAAAFGGLVPGGNAGGTGWGGDVGAYTGSNAPPGPIRAQHGVFGGGEANLSYGREPADTGSVAKGGLSFGPETGHSGYTRYEAKYGLPEGYLARTAQIESGGDPNAKNPNSSAGGLFQFVDGTAAQYGLENKFDPAQATDAAARLAADNKAYLTRVLGREPTAAELYLAHQQGAGGAAKLLANPNARAVDVVGADAVRLNGGDANMTAGQFASKWTGKFGGGSGASAAASTGPVDPLADPYVQRLMQVMAMPGLTPEQRSVVELQLQTRMGQLTATAKTEALPAGFRELDLQAQAGGLVPGTPEYQNFMLSGGAGATGGEGPAAFQALHMQALAAGFPEGSPEYKEFMATRGAGLAAESKAIGEAKGSAIAGAPAEVAAADETLGFIDEVRNHPGLDAGTGMSSMFNVVPGTPGYDFQNRVNQLLGGGFLTAIDQLRGMGALSNAEGQTATRAISRMDTATSKEEFLAALDDYERVVQQGRERAAGKLTEAPPSGAVSAPSTNDLGLSDDDLQYLGQP